VLLMNKLLLLSGVLALTALAPPTYKTYHNQRFGYRIDYPADLRPSPRPRMATAGASYRPTGRRRSAPTLATMRWTAAWRLTEK
jgi:hypothetical protein